MATLPYNPWRVLPPSANSTSVYILKPSFASSATSQLLSLDISQTLKSAGLVYETISSALPFITDEHSQSYIPTIGDNGSILVYTGDCRKDSRGSALWKFTSDHGGSPGTGQWDQLQVDLSADTTESTSLGAGYLSSGMTFAATRNSPVGIYIFGECARRSTPPNLKNGLKRLRTPIRCSRSTRLLLPLHLALRTNCPFLQPGEHPYQKRVSPLPSHTGLCTGFQ